MWKLKADGPVPDGYRSILSGIYAPEESLLEDTYEAFDSIFPNGLKLSKEGMEEYRNKIGILPSSGNLKSLQATLKRYGFIAVDRGTYSSPLKAPRLSQELQEEILNAVESQIRIEYRELFERFQKPLESIAVTNRYLLKSLIDPVLPENFKPGRDFIVRTDVEDSSLKELEASPNSPMVRLDSGTSVPVFELHLKDSEVEKLKRRLQSHISDKGFLPLNKVFDLIEDLDSFSTLHLSKVSLSSLLNALYPDILTSGTGVVLKGGGRGKVSYADAFLISFTGSSFTLDEANSFVKDLGGKLYTLIELMIAVKNQYMLVGGTTFRKVDKEKLIKPLKALLLRLDRGQYTPDEELDLPQVSGIDWNSQTILSLAMYAGRNSIRVHVENRSLKDLKYVLKAK